MLFVRQPAGCPVRSDARYGVNTSSVTSPHASPAAASYPHQRSSDDVAYDRIVFGEAWRATRRWSRNSSTGPTGR